MKIQLEASRSSTYLQKMRKYPKKLEKSQKSGFKNFDNKKGMNQHECNIG